MNKKIGKLTSYLLDNLDQDFFYNNPDEQFEILYFILENYEKNGLQNKSENNFFKKKTKKIKNI